MRYAELRNRLRAAELHAADMKRQADTATAVLLSLVREGECGHRTIRREGLPCPHPAHSRGGETLTLMEPEAPPSLYSSGDFPLTSSVRTTTLRRERYAHPSGDIWAWRALP